MPSWDRKTLSIGALVLAIILFLSLNILSSGSLRKVQLDLTANSLYSLSDGTREVLASVKEPITLRLFVSRELLDASPGLGSYSNRVRELVEQYVTLSGGTITLEVIDPEPFSPEEDRAVGFRLQGVPLTEGGDIGYFGLAGTNTTDDQDVIGFLSPQREQFLEYDLTRLINNLANPEKKIIGLVSGLPIDADPLKQYKPWRIVELMKQFFEVRSLGLEPEIKDDIDVLMIVHPFGLSDKSLYAIDQYVMRGGKTMVFVDPYAEEGSRSNQAMRLPPDQGSDLDELFKAWGIEYSRDKVLGDLRSAQRVSAGVDPSGRPIITNYLAWLTFPQERLSRTDVILSELQLINVASAGFIKKAKDSTVTLEPLITSTTDSMAVDAAKVRFQPDPSAILKTFKSGNESLILAARITGTLKSAFPKGPPKDKKDKEAAKKEDTDAKGKKEAKPVHLAVSKAPVNMIIVADSDILADAFWLQTQDLFGQKLVVPTANNADFVINALDNLSGSSALISLRSRGLSVRPFERVEELRQSAESQYRDKEQGLAKKLTDVQAKLKDLQTKEKAGSGVVLSSEQQETIDKFRSEMVTIRRDLREVQHALRKDIDNLDSWIKIINIGAMPVIIALLAGVLALVRRGRAKHRHAVAAG